MKAKTSTLIPVLTMAGSDCSGGAGIQADLKTFSAHGLFGMSVILSVVAENTARVISVHNIPPQSVAEQILAVFEDIPPKALKIGMINSPELMACVAENLAHFKPENIVIDPVMFAKNGFALMPVQNCAFFKENLLHCADILTPNIPEAAFLTGLKIHSEAEMKKAAEHLHKKGAKSVLIKGGHRSENADDIFFDGQDFHILRGERIETKNTHGTGCTLSAAIAANLALGKSLIQAVCEAKDYIRGAIYHSLNLGKGCGPTNHFFKNFS